MLVICIGSMQRYKNGRKIKKWHNQALQRTAIAVAELERYLDKYKKFHRYFAFMVI